MSAVARNLDPCTTECCGTEDWDYLICGLDARYDDCCDGEDFDAQVNALDICGCLTSATNTKLYAIDNEDYDVRDGSDGTIWTYEDCASKVGPTLVSPADGAVLDCQACEGCGAGSFNLKWDRMCNACSYDIEIMDEDGNVIVSIVDEKITGTSCNFFFNTADLDQLVCGSSYQWHVREANTDCECIHSRWSETWGFTVATSSSNGVQLISPEMAATDIGTTNVGFSWTSVPGANDLQLCAVAQRQPVRRPGEPGNLHHRLQLRRPAGLQQDLLLAGEGLEGHHPALNEQRGRLHHHGRAGSASASGCGSADPGAHHQHPARDADNPDLDLCHHRDWRRAGRGGDCPHRQDSETLVLN